MRRVVFNQKGGVGKTTIVCNLSAALAQIGRKVLVVDLDAQANTSDYLTGNQCSRDSGRTIADFFEAALGFSLTPIELSEFIRATRTANVDLLPSSRLLSDLQAKLESRYKVFKLANALDHLLATRQYDDVIIDTPPALNFFSVSGILASEKVIIPVDCDAFSLGALDEVASFVQELAADNQLDLTIEGVVVNHFQKNSRVSAHALGELAKKGYPTLAPVLSQSVAIRESHSAGLPIVSYRPKHKVSAEYLQLASNLIGDTASQRDRQSIKAKHRTKTNQISDPIIAAD